MEILVYSFHQQHPQLEAKVTDLEFSFLNFGLKVIKSLFLSDLLKNMFIFDIMIDTDPKFY